MKILIDSYNTSFQNVSGGVQIRIRNYVTELRKAGVDVKMYDKWQDKLEDYDILHVFKLNIESYALARLAKAKGLKVVVSSVVSLDEAVKIRTNLFVCSFLPIHTGYWFLQRFLTISDIILTESDEETRFIEKNYKVKTCQYIPNGVIINGNLNSTLASSRIKNDNAVILHVGRFDRNKNQLGIIKALKDQNIPVVFIGGKSDDDPLYYDKCRSEASKNMHFMGWLDNDDPLLASFYAKAKVVVLSSHNETFGLTIVEGALAGANIALSKGLPILNHGLSKYSFVFDPHNVQEMKEVILDAYNSPIRDGLQEFTTKEFSWNSVIEKHVEIYTSLLN